jgi:hypothetical protein
MSEITLSQSTKSCTTTNNCRNYLGPVNLGVNVAGKTISLTGTYKFPWQSDGATGLILLASPNLDWQKNPAWAFPSIVVT